MNKKMIPVKMLDRIEQGWINKVISLENLIIKWVRYGESQGHCKIKSCELCGLVKRSKKLVPRCYE